MYNHHDAEERCFSDCLAELPEYDTVEDKKVSSAFSIVDTRENLCIHQQKYDTLFVIFSIQVRALNLDLIKRRLDRFLYKRLDLFQRDIFSVLERARNLSRTDSQIFEDSYELQKHFIKVRDEVNEILSPMKWFIDVYILVTQLFSFNVSISSYMCSLFFRPANMVSYFNLVLYCTHNLILKSQSMI